MDQQDTSVRKLYRSRKDRVIAGVCGGIAEYFNIDPVWVRIAWVLSVFIKGLGLVAYPLCWILIPEREWSPEEAGTAEAGQGEGEARAAGASSAKGRARGLQLSTSQPHVIIGIVLIVLGFIFGLMAFVPFFSSQAFWAIVLIVLGLALIARR